MTGPARTAAVSALRAIEDNRTDLPTALLQSRQRLTDDRDRGLAAEIVHGTLRWRRSLDHLIAHFARRPADALDVEVRTILRASLYQLLHLDRVPASAVVDDAVNLTRAARKSSAAGFVNAVLRTLLRQRNRLPLPARPADGTDRATAIAYLGITHSHPEWLVTRWLDRLGFEDAERWVRFDNEAPRLTLRANRLRVTRDVLAASLAADDVETEPARYAADGLIVSSGNPMARATEGAFFVQDEASQLVPLAVAARAGDRVLDLCASPGGKSAQMAADMNDAGILVACDVRDRRVRLLRDTIAASGARHAHIVHVAREGPLPFDAVFDRVLVDAPCSGLGTIRRDPDIRWKRTPDDLAPLAAAQSLLLARAAAVVKPGGRLVYATCSSEPEENDAVVARFLSEHDDFQLAPLGGDDTPGLASVVDDRGYLRTLPHVHALEAFFAAALERTR